MCYSIAAVNLVFFYVAVRKLFKPGGTPFAYLDQPVA
jgi:hypothetical protein